MKRYTLESWKVGNIQINKVKNAFGFGDEFMYEVLIDEIRQSQIAHSLDVALLVALGVKYDGINSQFAYFANKMLGIEK